MRSPYQRRQAQTLSKKAGFSLETHQQNQTEEVGRGGGGPARVVKGIASNLEGQKLKFALG